MTLAAFLARAAGEPFRWGSADCCTFAADWIREACGIDPMAVHRGRYRTVIGAGRLVARGGGFVPWVTSCVEAAGLAAISEPQPGDIGVVAEGGREAVAIPIGPGWAARTERGLMIMPLPFLVAWALPCRR